MAWISVITNAGAALLARLPGGGHTLNLSGAAVGSGVISEANLRIASAISDYKASASIISAEDVDGGVKYKIQVGPAESEAYTAHQIGLYAQIDSEDPVLLALAQDSEGGVGVPLASVSPNFAFALFITVAISNDGETTVNIDESAYVTVGTMTDALAAQRAIYDKALARIGLTVYDDQFYIQPYEGE